MIGEVADCVRAAGDFSAIEPQLGLVPRQVRVIPREISEMSAEDARGRVEIVAFNQN